MKSQFKHLFATPIFEGDREIAWRAELLNATVNFGIFIMLLIGFGNIIGGQGDSIILMLDGVMIAVLLLIRVFLTKKLINPAAILLLCLAAIVVTAVIASIGTIRNPTTSSFMLIIIIGGLLFGKPGVIISSITSSLIVLGLILLENAGLLPEPEYAVTITQWISFSSFFGMTALLIYFSFNSRILALQRELEEIDKRKTSEAGLIASEERYRTQFNASPDPIIIHDGKVILDLNPAAVNAIGAKNKEALVGKDPFSFIAQADRERARQKLESILTNNLPFETAEFTIVTKQNDERIVLAIPSSIIFEGQQVIMVNFHDITERKHAELVLTNHNMRQEKLLETAHRLGSTLDIESILQKVSEETKMLLNCEGVTIYFLDESGHTLHPVASQDPHHDEEVLAAPLDIDNSLTGQVIKTKKGIIFNYALQQPGMFQIPGTPVTEDEHILVVPLMAQDDAIGTINLYRQGKLFGEDELVYATTIALYISSAINNARSHDAILREIEEREASEEALRVSEGLLRASQEAANIGSYVLDFKDGTWMSSQILKNIFGIDDKFVADIAGWVSIIHPEDKTMMEVYFNENILVHHESFNKEYRIKKNDTGEERWVLGLGKLQLDNEGEPLKMVGTIQDITSRKQIENERISLENQLRQSQKLEALGVMAGGIAHDFNNILQGLYLNIEIIKSQISADESLHDNFQHIIDASDRAKTLVQQILTFSRKEQTQLKPTLIQDLLHDALKLTRASTPASIEIIEDIDADCGAILCDKTKIHQVLINLCNNAIFAMEKMDGVLSVSLREVEAQIEVEPGVPASDKGKVAELIVSDTGLGMTPKILGQIFDPFFTTKDVDEGTGLGLAIVHGIIKEMHGQIIVKSKLGKGTTFRILLPLAH